LEHYFQLEIAYQRWFFLHVTSCGDRAARDYVFHRYRFIENPNFYAVGIGVFGDEFSPRPKDDGKD
jgi:hypothetical protein